MYRREEVTVLYRIGTHLLLAIIVTIGYSAFYEISENWFIFKGVSTWFMPLGWMLAWYLVLPYRFWPTITMGPPASYIFILQTIPLTVYMSLYSYFITAICYLIPLYICHRVLGLRAGETYLNSLGGVKSLFILIIVKQIGNVATLYEWAINDTNKPFHVEMIMAHFIGGFTGILITLPTLLALNHFIKNPTQINKRKIAPTIFALSVFSTAAVCLYQWFPDTLYLMRTLAFLFIVLCSYRYLWVGACLSTSAVTLLLMASTFGEVDSYPIHDTQFYLFIYEIAGTLLGAIFSDQHKLNKELRESLLQSQKLAKKVVNIQEQERKTLSQNLHDDIGQHLVVIQTEMQVLRQSQPSLNNNQTVKLIDASARHIYQATYDMLHWLRPRVLDEFGLYKVLTGNYFASRLRASGIEYQADIASCAGTFSHELSIAIFRIVQEAVVNCIKHSKATTFAVTLDNTSHSIALTVSDNGIGLREASQTSQRKNLGGFGVQGIKDRVAALKGRFYIKNSSGFTIQIELPM